MSWLRPRAGPPRPPRWHSHTEQDLDALELWEQYERRKGNIVLCGGTRDACQRLGIAADSEIIVFLVGDELAKIPLFMGIDLLRPELMKRGYICHQRREETLAGCKVGLILPLPPHVLAYFINMKGTAATETLSAEGHHLPHEFDRRGISVTTGFRAARARIRDFDVIVIDLIKPNGEWHGSPTAADLLEANYLNPDARIYAHIRPRIHKDDTPINPNVASRIKAL